MLLILLYGVISLATAQLESNDDPEIDWVDCHNHVPHTLLESFPGTHLTVLPSTLHCGRIVVPMNYDKPISSTNNITLGLAMYRPADPTGVIF